ncbi:MAG: endonuclease/exonuclease/phosphatase family protein [Bacteroidales bacterium]|nr:endonuclease/exonuclease/phosphatase family protein [Bacteroidales bacterium]HOI31877.1 endonuclease/exonuclease/phosphatase family protein [Bacteroidales bacterium]
MKTIFRLLAGLVAFIIIVLGLFLLFIQLNDFNPPTQMKITVDGMAQKRQVPDELIRLISWNIGYGGLGKEMDFFYDGGKKVRASEEQSQEWMHQISRWIAQNSGVDFLFLQEVDFKAKRTYFKDQSQQLAPLLPNHEMIRAVNYKIPFVPVPIYNPMGKVEAGMLTFSAYKSIENIRFAYPQIAGWPDRMFLLDRCFIKSRFATSLGNELVIFNTHNSAFIDDPQKMQHELQSIRDQMLLEHQLGNFVIAGGDWNMNPPDLKKLTYKSGHLFAAAPVHFPEHFFPADWQFVYDKSVPSNRQMHEAYRKGITGTTTIDFFILSPGITLKNIETIDLNFEMSDHNPVMIEVNLKNI